jgi:hypothetical protein
MVILITLHITNKDELFDFDETIPNISIENPNSIPTSSIPAQIRSPLFAPPLSPFRPRSIEKYLLPSSPTEEENPLDNPALENGGTKTGRESPFSSSVLSESYSKPIAITPPSRSFLKEGLGLEDDCDEGGMKGLIERISLKNTRSGRGRFGEQRMLWDIPGDHYRSVPS